MGEELHSASVWRSIPLGQYNRLFCREEWEKTSWVSDDLFKFWVCYENEDILPGQLLWDEWSSPTRMHLIDPLHQWLIPHLPKRLWETEQMSCNKSIQLLIINHNKLYCGLRLTLPMPSAVCSARTSLRTLTPSLRVAGRQLQSTTIAKPSTTCSTPNGGVRSTGREWPLLEPCLRQIVFKNHARPQDILYVTVDTQIKNPEHKV